MTKDEFEKLSVIDKVDYINEGLKNNKKVTEIRESIGISEKELQRFMKNYNYKFNQKLKQYTTTETTTTSTTNPTTQTDTRDLRNTTMELTSVNHAKTLDYLSENIDILTKLINHYKTTTISTTSDIIINLIDDKHLNPKPKSIRINEHVYGEWQEFCKDKKYSKMELVSMALKEYMKNHS
jgi:hypothetical protein